MTQVAERMGREQREISISQFFEKNRHLLGYDNKIKALLTIVREGVDNALDATEEAGILPDIYIKLEEVRKEKYKVVVKDNGPGIVVKQIPNIFGKLLYGSKFHRLKQSRGQQGIGISGCVLYAQLTTGEATKIITSTGNGKTHKVSLNIDVKKNTPKILSDKIIEDKDNKWNGVQITFVVEGIYREHKQSVLEYLKQVAISNPYANIVFDSPNGRIEFARGVDELPPEPKEIRPHLYGVEVGIMKRMIEETKARSISGFLTTEFSRIGKLSAMDICKRAEIDPQIMPRKLKHEDIVNIIDAVKESKLTRPPTDCLSPLGNGFIESGLKKELNPEFVSVLSRPPEVYRGWPFQIEVGIAYGGSVMEPQVMRFANRVPLLYQQGDCAITKAVMQIDWRRYGIEGNKTPEGPVVLFIHVASVWVPFNSEAKESIANYPVIIKEIKLALQDCSRRLYSYLSGVRRAAAIEEKKMIFEKYATETAIALEELTGNKSEGIKKKILEIVKERWTEITEVDNGGPAPPSEEPVKEGGENNANQEAGEEENGESGESGKESEEPG
jgi:DNA topoisomerase-6 subunit B